MIHSGTTSDPQLCRRKLLKASSKPDPSRIPIMATRRGARPAGVIITSTGPTTVQSSSSNTPSEIEFEAVPWTPSNFIKLTDKLSYADFRGSGHEFKSPEGSSLSETEHILIDNIFVAHKRRDLKHQIANLNGLFHMFTEKEKYYVVVEGHKPGLYQEWDEVIEATRGYKGARYKKYHNMGDAVQVAQRLITQELTISPKLQAQYQAFLLEEPITAGAGINKLQNDLILAKKQNLEHEKTIMKLAAHVAHLTEELPKAKATIKKKERPTSRRLSEKTPTIDKILTAMAHIKPP